MMNSLSSRSLWPAVFSALAALTVLFFAPDARALGTMIVIDEFNSGAQWLDLSGAPAGVLNDTATGSSILGGSRELTYIVGSNPLGTGAQAGVHSLSPGMFSVQQGNDVTSITLLRYDAAGTGLGGVDFTGSGDNALVVNLALADAPVSIGVSLIDTAGREATLDDTLPGPIAGALHLSFPFSAFDNPTGADFTSVNSLSFQFTPQSPGAGFAIQFLGLTGVPVTVPEPDTMFLLAMTFAAVVFRRSRGVLPSG